VTSEGGKEERRKGDDEEAKGRDAEPRPQAKPREYEMSRCRGVEAKLTSFKEKRR
jgi:hypothetical protein